MIRILVLCFMLVWCSFAQAEIVQPNDDFWYLDEADVLSEATEGEIFFANQRLYDACGAEIVVAAIDSTGGMSIDDYAYSMFNQWEIGGDSYRGFLLLMAIEDDNYYAMPGTALSVYFDSATVDEMLVKHLEPDFADKRYDVGARKLFEAVYEKVADDLNLNLSIEDAVADYDAFNRDHSPISNGQSAPAQIVLEERRSRSSILPIVFLLIVLVFVTSRFHSRSRSHGATQARVHRSSRSASMFTGFMLGRMSRPHHRPPMGMHARPPMGGFSSHHRRADGNPFGNSSRSNFRRNTGGFGGASRGGAGRSVGGFGGARRSGGASRGPSTRGGGAGRFSRR